MSIIHDKHIIRINDFFHIVRDQNDCHTFLPVQTMHRVQYFFPSIWIQHGGRLIHNNALRLHRHDTGNRHTLLLSAGQTVWGMIAICCHADCLQALSDTLPDFLRRNTDIFRTKGHIFFHDSGHLIIRILKDHTGFLADIQNVLLF